MQKALQKVLEAPEILQNTLKALQKAPQKAVKALQSPLQKLNRKL